MDGVNTSRRGSLLRNSKSGRVKRGAQTPRRTVVTSSTAAAAAVYGPALRNSAAVPQAKAPTILRTPLKTASASQGQSANSSPVPSPAVQWFPPALIDPEESESEIEDNDSIPESASPPLPEIIEAEEADIVLSSPGDLPEVNASAHELRHFLHLDESQDPAGPLTASSEIRLVKFTSNDSFPSSAGTFPSVRDLTSSASKSAGHRSVSRSKSSKKAWTGRYKVKYGQLNFKSQSECLIFLLRMHRVLEQSGGKKSRGPRAMDTNSPYHADDFIDVDGKLKLMGKGFETYVTRPQYQLLKDFYVPGIIASRVAKRASRSKQSDSSLATAASRGSQRSSSPAAKKWSHAQEVTVTDVDQIHEVTQGKGQNQEVTEVVPANAASLPSSHSNELRPETVEIEAQTVEPISFSQESQTAKFRHRQSVEFDLDGTTVEGFEPDSDRDLTGAGSNHSVTSAMAILSGWDLDSDFLDTDVPEEVLWDRKVTTAVQMVAAILAAQKAGTDSLESKSLLRTLDLLGSGHLQEVMGLLESGQEPSEALQGADVQESEALLRLMEAYGAAYESILGHIRASEAYVSQFPEAELTLEDSGTLTESTKSLPKISAEPAGDAAINDSPAQIKSLEIIQNSKEADTSAIYCQHPNYLRYSPELTSTQLKIQLGANPDHLFQEIQFQDMTFRLTYGVTGVSSILSASCDKTATVQVFSGNLLLMHNQQASALGSRLLTSKYYFNRVLLQLMSLGELFLVGKYTKLANEETQSISPGKYTALRQINVFTGVLFPICNSFVSATTKIQGSLQELAKARGALSEQSPIILIGQPRKATQNEPPEVTIPMTGVLPAQPAYRTLLTALEEIESIILTGSVSLGAFNRGKGVKVPSKYFRTLETCLEGVKQLGRGRDLDFGALLIGYMVDLTLLRKLEGQGSFALEQRAHLNRNYVELSRSLQDLTKLGRKASLICSFASSRSMLHLRKFRYAQKLEVGCFSGVFKPFQRRKEARKEEEEEAIPDLTLEKTSLEEDNSKLVQMLRAISKESSLSFTIF